MRDLDAFLDRALDGREPDDEPDPVPVLDRLPRVARVPVPRVLRRMPAPSLDACRVELDALLRQVPRRAGVYVLGDFRVSLWKCWDVDDHGRLLDVQEEAARLMLDDRLAEDWAALFGVTVPVFRRWREAVLTPEGNFWLEEDWEVVHCTGTTKRGKRCRNWLEPFGPEWEHPGDFRPGITDRCHLHKEHADVAPSKPPDAAS